MTSNQKSLWMGISALATFFVVLPLCEKGAFVDGLTYASISRNLAEGLGTFWTPHYTEFLHPQFHEHPPLVFGLQSLLFRLFGDLFWVEGLYSLLCWLLIARGLYVFAKRLFPKTNETIAPVAVLLWVLTPLIWFGTTNNLLENTTTVFTLWSSYYLVFVTEKNRWSYLVFASSLLIGAFLSKGMVGLFPMAIPVIRWVFEKENRRNITLDFGLLLAITGAIFALLSLWQPEMIPSLKQYFSQQLLPALDGKRENSPHSRFWIWGQMLLELGIPILMLLFAFWKGKWRRPTPKLWIVFFLWMSASLPLALSPKQSAFYLIPALPYGILFLLGVLSPALVYYGKSQGERLKNSHSKKLFRASTIILLLVTWVLVGMRWGNIKRDEALIHDVVEIAKTLPEVKELSVPLKVTSDWKTIAYFMRMGHISVGAPNSDHYLLPKGYPPPNTKQWEKVLELSEHTVYRRRIEGKY